MRAAFLRIAVALLRPREQELGFLTRVSKSWRRFRRRDADVVIL